MNPIRRGLVAMLFLLGGQAQADLIEYVELEFASGAIWQGTITFNDGYEGMLDANGWLTGGSHGFNEFVSWTWWDGTGQSNPADWNVDGWYEDWLMNGNEGVGDYTVYLGLSWSASVSVDAGGIQFILLNDPEYSGNLAYNDLLIGWSATAVPLPSSLALLALGGYLLLRRREQLLPCRSIGPRLR